MAYPRFAAGWLGSQLSPRWHSIRLALAAHWFTDSCSRAVVRWRRPVAASAHQGAHRAAAAAAPQHSADSREASLGASAAAAYQPRQRMQESQEDDHLVFAKPPPPDLKCSICLELFRDPLITKCGHTFCSRCVYQVSGGASGDQCAVCRKSVVVTE
eukprot:COSAG01_NODE_11152_length_1994_cov_10.672823_2_plen_156_part_01